MTAGDTSKLRLTGPVLPAGVATGVAPLKGVPGVDVNNVPSSPSWLQPCVNLLTDNCNSTYFSCRKSEGGLRDLKCWLAADEEQADLLTRPSAAYPATGGTRR